MKTQEYEVGESVVILRIGDMLTSKSEVIVSSDDDNFTMRGGVSLAILRAGGPEIKRQAQEQAAKRGLGDIIETTAGNLPYKRLYHVVSRFDGRRDKFDLNTTQTCITKAVENCIQRLSQSVYSSIAFPAIGTGYAGHAPAEVAAAFAKALGSQLALSTRKVQVELYLHPDSFAGDLSFLEFFRAFDNKAQWQAKVVRDHAVAMIHGIRTEGRWLDEVGGWLRKADRSINPVPIGYGFFDVFSFLLPIPAIRRRLINKVAADLVVLTETKSTKRLSIIAHSFGTFLTAHALARSGQVKVHRLILCGSIVPRDFDWTRLRDRLDVIDENDFPQVRVINDYGWRDIWPVFAHTITCGYGSSGRLGFGNPQVTDRSHNLSHSEFFTEKFVATYWVPAIVKGQIVPNSAKRPPSAWLLMVLTRIHVKFIVAIGLAAWTVSRVL